MWQRELRSSSQGREAELGAGFVCGHDALGDVDLEALGAFGLGLSQGLDQGVCLHFGLDQQSRVDAEYEMNTIYLAWQDWRSRRWFPVGRLVRNNSGTCKYEFVYIQGARQAKESDGFFGIPGFRKLDEQYRADELFPNCIHGVAR